MTEFRKMIFYEILKLTFLQVALMMSDSPLCPSGGKRKWCWAEENAAVFQELLFLVHESQIRISYDVHT